MQNNKITIYKKLYLLEKKTIIRASKYKIRVTQFFIYLIQSRI